jgi:hypothetical protein
MGEIVNLRTARKRAAKAADAKMAEANRARHGMSGAEKRRIAAEEARAQALLDGHRLSPDGPQAEAPTPAAPPQKP